MVLNVDCRTHDPDFDVLITDPPYSDHVHSRVRSNAQHGAVKGVRQNDLKFDSITDSLQDYVGACARKARKWSAIFTDIQQVNAWEQQVGGQAKSKHPRHIRTVPWIRWSMPQLSGDRPPSGCELIVLGHAPGRCVYDGPGNLISFQQKCLRGSGKHPTEKPLDLMLDLVRFFSAPDDIVYDPCAGSGTTGVACALLGRRFTGCEYGCEESSMWAEKSNARISAAANGWLSGRDRERLNRWRELRPDSVDQLTVRASI